MLDENCRFPEKQNSVPISFSAPPEPQIFEVPRVPQEEERSLAQWINNNLECDEDCSHLLPLESDGGDLYQKIEDGILLW